MPKTRFTITVNELIKEGYKIKYGEKYTDDTSKWNAICGEFDFCNNELSSETWSKGDVDEILEDEPERLEFLALKNLMGTKKEALIIRS